MFNTIILLSILTALLALVGGILGGIWGVAVALIFSALLNFSLFLKSDSLILRLYRARPTDDYKLKGMVKKLAREAKIPVPRLYIIKTTHFVPNAFAVGRDTKHSSIAITASLLDLKDDEIEAVLAHEIAHIRNHDTLVNVMAATIGGAISFIAQWGYWYLFLEGGDMESGVHFTGIILMAIFAPIAAFMIRMAISRSMEFRADYVAALLTKRPRSLARALEKIHDAASQKPLRGSAATSHLWIANPFHKDRFTSLFSTHPPVRERMRKLLELEGRGLD
jgi:heat shock protein HtpX